jgi:hypothetical protein
MFPYILLLFKTILSHSKINAILMRLFFVRHDFKETI